MVDVVLRMRRKSSGVEDVLEDVRRKGKKKEDVKDHTVLHLMKRSSSSYSSASVAIAHSK